MFSIPGILRYSGYYYDPKFEFAAVGDVGHICKQIMAVPSIETGNMKKQHTIQYFVILGVIKKLYNGT